MTRKKILHLIESGGVYGAEQVILNLADEQLSGEEFFPIIGCIVNHPNEASALYDRAVSQNIAAIKLCLPIKSFLFNVFPAAGLLQKEEIKVIHTHGYKPAVFGFVMAKIMKIPIVATCHNWTLSAASPRKMKLMIKVEKYLYRYFNRVVAVSNAVAEILRRSNVPDGKISLINNGVKLPKSQQEKASIRSELGLSPSDFVIVHVARLCEVKDQTTLITAIQRLREKFNQVKLLIVGDGPDKSKLQELTRNLSLQNHVIFVGFQDDPSSYYEVSDCFCLSSKDEGMPISLLEAVAYQLPVVATNVGNIAQLISDTTLGFLVSPESPQELAEALSNVITSDAWTTRAVSLAYHKLIADYSAYAMSEKYRAIYTGALND